CASPDPNRLWPAMRAETSETERGSRIVSRSSFIFAGLLFLLASSHGSAEWQVTSRQPNAERLNLNTATVEELAQLPGIGPAIAARVVEHRRRHGRFKRPQEIIVVRGMSPRRYRNIAHLIGI
ncbi:MAG TPA: helix-hairpin-helix domain-containing protein, partial [Blastocatellia bacterium]|nr:helix-hairpin-helix domain-containing protein [Blastocatellia bacterium]